MQLIHCALLLVIATTSFAISVEKDLSLTLKEKQALDKFKLKVKPFLKNGFMKSDIYLIRWLRARNFDINAAEVMLKENLKWRQENKIDTILQENFDDMIEEYPTTLKSQDKLNRPLATIDVYDWDIREAAISGKGRRLLRYLDMCMENLTMQVYHRQQIGMNVTQWAVLSNTERFNMINHGCPICIPIWIQFLHSLESNYPGWMDEFIVLDAPLAVHTVFDIVKPFLAQRTRNSIKIFGMNKNLWMPYLDARIRREERYQMYGGTKASNHKFRSQ